MLELVADFRTNVAGVANIALMLGEIGHFDSSHYGARTVQ